MQCPSFRCLSPLPWAPAGFFSGVGKLGVRRRKSPSGATDEVMVGSGVAPPPEADDWQWKECINNSFAERFAVIIMHKTLYNISRGGGKCPSCSCLRAPMTRPLHVLIFHRRTRDVSRVVNYHPQKHSKTSVFFVWKSTRLDPALDLNTGIKCE